MLASYFIPRNMDARTPVVRTFYTIPHSPYISFDNKLITCVEIEITSENKHVDVDVFGGGIGAHWINMVVTGYNTQIFNSKATVYGIRRN